jgi:hypothetical protein
VEYVGSDGEYRFDIFSCFLLSFLCFSSCAFLAKNFYLPDHRINGRRHAVLAAIFPAQLARKSICGYGIRRVNRYERPRVP